MSAALAPLQFIIKEKEKKRTSKNPYAIIRSKRHVHPIERGIYRYIVQSFVKIRS